MITPILKDPKKHGGTLYTFPSASRDLTRAFTNSEYEFAFSHFACLNLPDFRYGSFENGDLKGVYLDNLSKFYSYPNSGSDEDSDTLSDEVYNDFNKHLKWHMQSYVMNYEVAILNGFSLDAGRYDNEILRTPSERIFFNWLQKVGAIKFKNNKETIEGYGDDSDKNITYDESSYTTEDSLKNSPNADKSKTYKIGNKLYKWKGGEWRSRVLVSKTVQYIGTIDMINNVNIDYDSFNEIYLNIPAGVGGSTDIYFNNIFDDNYESGECIDVSKDDFCKNKTYIIGREPEDLNISGLDEITLKAIYDSKYEHDTGYSEPVYKIDTGYCIDFNDEEYGGSIEQMNLESEEDFEFNCVLIYYRIRKGNGDWYTNLYGVLFLEEVSTSDYNTKNNEDDERAGYIQRYPKFKKGNSWGLKLDLKIDAQPDSQLELRDKVYDDPNEGSGMQMFTEALMQLNDCVKLFYEVKKENTDIEERLYELENIVSGIDAVYDLRSEVGSLRARVETFQPTLNSLEGRMESIESRVTKLEINLGYLINNIPSVNIDEMRNEWSDFKDIVQENIKKVEYTNSQMKDDITNLGGQYGLLISDIENINDSIINIETSNENTNEILEKLQNQVQIDYIDINSKLSQLQTNVSENIQKIDSDISNLAEQCEKIEKMDIDVKLNDLRDDVNENNKMIKDSAANVSLLFDELHSDLENDFSSVRNSISDLKENTTKRFTQIAQRLEDLEDINNIPEIADSDPVDINGGLD